jgi:hypothetical protein
VNTVLRVPTKATTIRLDPALLTWVDSYATERGANRTQIIEAAVRSFRDDARRGVPELPPPASSAPQGKGALEEPSATARPERSAPAAPRAPQRKAVIAPFDLNPVEDPGAVRARDDRLAAIQARQAKLNAAKARGG